MRNPVTRVRMNFWAARAMAEDDPLQKAEWLRRSLAEAVKYGDAHGIAAGHHLLADALLEAQDVPEAVRELELARLGYLELGLEREIANTEFMMVTAPKTTLSDELIIERGDSAIQWYISNQLPAGAARLRRPIAFAHRRRKEYEQAIRHLTAERDFHNAVGADEPLFWCRSLIGLIRTDMGQDGRAVADLRWSVAAATRLGNAEFAVINAGRLAGALTRLGRPTEARDAMEGVLGQLDDIDDWTEVVKARHRYFDILNALQAFDETAVQAQLVVDLCVEHGEPVRAREAAFRLGIIAVNRGDPTAEGHLRFALEGFEAVGEANRLGLAARRLANISADRGDYESAHRLMVQARDSFDESDDPGAAEIAEAMLPQYLARAGHLDESEAEYASITAGHRSREMRAWVLSDWARTAMNRDDPAAAVAHATAALELTEHEDASVHLEFATRWQVIAREALDGPEGALAELRAGLGRLRARGDHEAVARLQKRFEHLPPLGGE